MIIFVGGLMGAGKSTVAKGLAERMSYYYYDVDEVKKVVYRQDPNFERNITEGRRFSADLLDEVYRRVFEDVERLIVDHPNIVIDESLYNREFRRAQYENARRIAGDFINIWVQAREEIILKRLGSKKRDGHILDDPLPLYHAVRDDFQEYDRCVIDCPNNGRAEDAIDNLVRLIKSVGALASERGTGSNRT